MKSLEKYEPVKVVRVSQELYQIGNCRWKMTTLGYRLLFALAQSVGGLDTDVLFPELWFEKQTLFKYLGLSSTERKYELLAKVLEEITDKGLHIATKKQNGALMWQGYTWVTSYRLAQDERHVMLRLNEDVKPFLVNLKQYASILPKYYLRLSTEYQNWFYPYFKNVVRLGQWTVSIEELKLALFLEDHSTYNPKFNKNATEAFLRKVIGIEISAAAKEENRISKALKREPRLIAWDYAKDKNGKATGTLAGITANSDINVAACAKKTGRAYTHIVFFLSEKASEISKHRASRLATESVTTDFGKRQEKTSRSGAKGMRDLFEEPFIGERIKNPAHEQDIPVPRVQCYTKQQILQTAQESGISFEKAVELLKVVKGRGDKYFKEY